MAKKRRRVSKSKKRSKAAKGRLTALPKHHLTRARTHARTLAAQLDQPTDETEKDLLSAARGLVDAINARAALGNLVNVPDAHVPPIAPPTPTAPTPAPRSGPTIVGLGTIDGIPITLAPDGREITALSDAELLALGTGPARREYDRRHPIQHPPQEGVPG